MGAPRVHAIIGISRLSQMTGVTPRALRHYEEVGLLRPHRTATGVRLFAPDQCERAHLIVSLRRCDVSLDDIGAVLASPEPAGRVRDLLRRRAEELAGQLDRVNAVLAGPLAEARRDAA